MNYRKTTSALAAALCAAAVTVLSASATVLPASAATAGARLAAPPPTAHALLGLSCVTAKNCLAVGEDQNAFHGSGGPLAERWNGTTWQTIGVKLPAGATGGVLLGVSCVSATHCVAVGFYDKGSGNQFALADTWNGKAWTPAQPPAPGGVNTALGGVSCKSAASCVAVGSYTVNTASGPGAPLAEIWNGKTWTQTRPPGPASGNVFTGLNAVSCVSPVHCVAAGASITNTASVALIESWNGRSWTRMKPAAAPGGLTDLTLDGVSCASASSCAAVGFAASAKGLGSLAEIWNGKSWRLTTVPWTKGTANPALSGVSCVTANRCVAVGTIDSNLTGVGNTGRAAAATWSGKAWTVTGVPAPAKGKASLFKDATCLSAADCVAIGQVGPFGSTNGTGLSGFWNGKSWRLVAAK